MRLWDFFVACGPGDLVEVEGVINSVLNLVASARRFKCGCRLSFQQDD